jgi:hypothetical protein
MQTNGTQFTVSGSPLHPGLNTLTVVVQNINLQNLLGNASWTGLALNATLTGTCINRACGILKACKIAGPGIPTTPITSFPISYSSSVVSDSWTIPAGPAPGGYCVLSPSLPVNTSVTIKEIVPQDDYVSNITVAPLSILAPVSPNQNPNPNQDAGSVTIVIGSGVNEVTYTNASTGYLEICKEAGSGVAPNTIFTFNASPGTKYVPGGPNNMGPFEVPAGACSSAKQVSAGKWTIKESPSTVQTNQGPPAIVSSSTIPSGRQDLWTASTSTVNVVPGDISTQTIAIITNANGGPSCPGCNSQ